MKSDSKQGSESSNCEFVICSNRISTDAVISPSSTTVKNSANAGEQSTSISDNRNSTIIKVVDDATTEIVSGEQVYKSHTVIESIPNGMYERSYRIFCCSLQNLKASENITF